MTAGIKEEGGLNDSRDVGRGGPLNDSRDVGRGGP